MSDFLVSLHAEAFLARLRGAPQRLHSAMLSTVTRLSILVQGSVKQKLSGPVLKNQSGNLRRSINRSITDDSSGVIATIGTNVKYAAVHEYGFDGMVNVRAHVRHLRERSTTVLRQGKGGMGVYAKNRGELTGGVANVREFARHMVMPERSYLRSTVADYAPQIRLETKAAALAALQPK